MAARYDVGRIVSELQATYFPRTMVASGQLQEIANDPESPHNLATPAQLRVLLDALADVTAYVHQPLHKELVVGKVTQADYEAYQDWVTRLDAYADAANEAQDDDRAAVFESVTAPLLLGLYDGEDSSRVPDAATPFRLANLISESTEARTSRLRQFFSDITNNTISLPFDLKDLVVDAGKKVAYVIGGLAVGALVLWKLTR